VGFKKRGFFITLEGGEGCGKTTQSHLLAEALRAQGHEVILTREPGGCPTAEAIREFVLTKRDIPFEPLTEALMMLSARHEHVTKLIYPALDAGKTVLCDRFSDSTLVYQGYAGGVPVHVLRSLIADVVGGFKPDLTFVFDVPVEAAEQRRKIRGGTQDQMESKDRSFHEKVRAGFLELARHEPDRIQVIKADQSVEQVFAAVEGAIKLLLAR
jgi:dTMP kinase